jgi:hypothetical protein
MEGIRVIVRPKTICPQMRILIRTKLIQINLRFRPMMLSDLLNIQETHIHPATGCVKVSWCFSSRFWQTGLRPCILAMILL